MNAEPQPASECAAGKIEDGLGAYIDYRQPDGTLETMIYQGEGVRQMRSREGAYTVTCLVGIIRIGEEIFSSDEERGEGAARQVPAGEWIAIEVVPGTGRAIYLVRYL